MCFQGVKTCIKPNLEWASLDFQWNKKICSTTCSSDSKTWNCVKIYVFSVVEEGNKTSSGLYYWQHQNIAKGWTEFFANLTFSIFQVRHCHMLNCHCVSHEITTVMNWHRKATMILYINCFQHPKWNKYRLTLNVNIWWIVFAIISTSLFIHFHSGFMKTHTLWSHVSNDYFVHHVLHKKLEISQKNCEYFFSYQHTKHWNT